MLPHTHINCTLVYSDQCKDPADSRLGQTKICGSGSDKTDILPGKTFFPRGSSPTTQGHQCRIFLQTPKIKTYRVGADVTLSINIMVVKMFVGKMKENKNKK